MEADLVAELDTHPERQQQRIHQILDRDKNACVCVDCRWKSSLTATTAA